MKKIEKVCRCGTPFTTTPTDVRRGYGKYCCRACPALAVKRRLSTNRAVPDRIGAYWIEEEPYDNS